jgi:hypothetical protein
MRSSLIVMGTLLGVTVAAACVAVRSDTGEISLGPCVGNVAKEIPLSECPVTCSGTVAFALCDGTKYTSCGCTLPGGFHLAGDDGGAVDAEPDSSFSPLDSEGLELGPCSGKVVIAIPASDCTSLCIGSLAFAVCIDGRYSECTCNIPKGYKIAVQETGPVESSMDAGFDADDAPSDTASAADGRDGG